VCSSDLPKDIPEQMQAIKMRKNKRIIAQNLQSDQQPSTSTTDAEPPSTPPPAKKRRTCQEIYQSLHPMEKKRRSTNKSIRKLCSNSGCLFLETWRCVQHKKSKEVNLDFFADDGLHLNEQGIAAMSEYIEGNIQRLLPAPKSRKRANKKKKKVAKNDRT
jgi:hypothetical protein